MALNLHSKTSGHLQFNNSLFWLQNLQKSENINTYAQNITQHIISIAKECIPNKIVNINTSDPPWITTTIKRYIRKRKRAYRKAKLLNTFTIWAKFKKTEEQNQFYDTQIKNQIL